MQIEGLIAPGADDLGTLRKLADMMGESFLEENWTRYILNALPDATDARKLAISQELLYVDFTSGTQYPVCFATPDLAACAGVYRKSDLGDKNWDEVEDEGHAKMARDFLTAEEAQVYVGTCEKIAPVSDFGWQPARAAETGYSDYLHMYVLGVDKNARGTGAFRRLMTPIYAYADERGLPCYLETYSDDLVSLYEHVGFKQIKTLSMEGVELRETLMERLPQGK